MEVNNQLKEYLYSIYDKKNIVDILHKNSLFGLIGNQFVNFDDNDYKVLKKKRIDVRYLENALKKICILLDKNQIEYCTFKGVVIANQLYGDNNCRQLSDIDIFVPHHEFDNALVILEKEGFVLKNKDGLKNQHHVVLTNQHIIIELHRNILTPLIVIDENYLRNNVILVDLFGYKIKTFDITATLIHLIYHLYMDTCLSSNNIYAINTNKSYGIANRFLYRAYEIALFAEKYFKDIKWDDIISDIKTQKLRIVFKYMAEDILEIFPNAFPAKLVDAINSLEYVGQQNDDVYKILRTAKAEHDNNVDLVLSKYIDENWNYNNTATYKHLGECFEISKPVGEEPCENKTLSCKLLIDRCEEGISLQFTVSDDDFYISEYNNFGTLESDGVHLLLCGTQKYTYMSIFLVPKIKNDSIEVFAYDVLNNTVIDSMDIQGRIQKYDDYYVLQAVLSNEFLSKHEIDKYFYVGFVISDCDRETKYRKNSLVSAEPATEWYNPLHFLKIDLLD